MTEIYLDSDTRWRRFINPALIGMRSLRCAYVDAANVQGTATFYVRKDAFVAGQAVTIRIPSDASFGPMLSPVDTPLVRRQLIVFPIVYGMVIALLIWAL